MPSKLLKKHKRKIIVCYIMLLVWAVIALCGLYGAGWYEDTCYRAWLKKDGTPAQVIDAAKKAIELKPEEPEAYHRVLDMMLQDNVLSKAEHAQLTKIIKPHQDKLYSNIDASAGLYRRLAFTILSSYDDNAQERMRAAYSYLEFSQQAEQNTTAVERSYVAAVLSLEAYYDEYIWLTGTNRAPTAVQLKEMILQAQMLLESMTSDTMRLSYACCLADLLQEHGQVWVDTLGAEAVSAFADTLAMQAEYAVDKQATGLLEELTEWTYKAHPWKEEMPDVPVIE